MEDIEKLEENTDGIKNLGEREYRSLPLDSYSSIKDFLTNRTKYYKKYILKEKVDETKEQGAEDMRFGNVVDCLKFSPEEFENRYQISTAGVPESPQMLKFINNLHSLCVKNTNEQGVICANLEDLIGDAYVQTGIKRDTLDSWKEKFLIKKEGYDYFIELKDRGNKIVISSEEWKWALDIKDYINKHPFTKNIMNLENSEKYKVFPQFKLTGIIKGMKLKMMEDLVIFNEEKKIITPLDLKVMSNNTIFPYNYIKLKYYIQNGTYVFLLRQNYPEYKVNPITFVTIDKYRQNDPINVRTSEAQFQDALKGFVLDGRKYKGLYQAIEELSWHKESGIWTCDKATHDNHGFSDLVLNNLTED